jgi:hypothetical protein
MQVIESLKAEETMSLRMILIPLCIAYIALIIWLLFRYKSKVLPALDLTNINSNKRLTLLVYRSLGFFQGFVLLVLFLMLPLLLVMTISQYGNPDWGIDIGVFANLSINLNEITGLNIAPSGIRNPEFSTTAIINMDTYSLYAYYFFALTSVVGGIVVFYILLQLRKLFASLLIDSAFTQENSTRIRRIGYAVTLWSIASPFLQYFGGRTILNDIAFSAPGFQFNPSFEIPVVGIFAGLIIIVLSGVIDEAARIQKDQELTI